MKKLTWLTDIHLNFLEYDARKAFYKNILDTQCDAILISGDIAEAPNIVQLLNEMANVIQKPIYFVLGNHDYYRGTIEGVREEMMTLTQKDNDLYWLPTSGLISLTDDVILIGQDGWADGRFGNYQNSNIKLNDERMIADLFQAAILGRQSLLQKMQQLADFDAAKLQDDLEKAVTKKPRKIIVVTHIPPYKEACFHQGKMSDDNWMPYFSSKATGDIIEQFATNNPSIEFLVLCGHTHSEAIYQPFENLIVKSGKAKYYQPATQELIKI